MLIAAVTEGWRFPAVRGMPGAAGRVPPAEGAADQPVEDRAEPEQGVGRDEAAQGTGRDGTDRAVRRGRVEASGGSDSGSRAGC
jgi:hypothetical protein